MRHQLVQRTRSAIYSGEYVPQFEKEDLRKYRKKPSKCLLKNISESIEETGNCYVIRLKISGITRKDFLVEVNDHFLNVIVLSPQYPVHKGSELTTPRVAYFKSFIHKIALLADADPLFVNARFSEGLLEVYIPKSEYPVKGINTRIAVY